MPKHSAHVLLFNKDSHFLLIRRKDVPFWVISGGRVEGDEKPVETAAREFWEETGVSVKTSELKLACEYQKTGNSYPKYTFIGITKSTIQPKLTNESIDFGFFSLEKLPEPLSLYERKRIIEAVSVFEKKVAKVSREDIINWPTELKYGFMQNPGEFTKLMFLYIWMVVQRKILKI